MMNQAWAPKAKMTEREIIQQLLIMSEANKRAISKNISGLTPRSGEEVSWERWDQCGEWLRKQYRAIEGAQKNV